MVMFEKLFVKRTLEDVSRSRSRRSHYLAPEQVRLLLFKECDWRGRKVLFDSITVEKVPSKKDDKPSVGSFKGIPYILEVANGYTYMYKGPAEDASVLGEMIFGAVAMNCKNASFKIHIMDEPKRLMCSKVFCIPMPRNVSRKSSESAVQTEMRKNESNPLRNLSKEEGMSLSFSIDRGDSGFYGEHSSRSSVCLSNDYFSMLDVWGASPLQDDNSSFHSPSGRKLSTSSNGSWQRRTFQSMLTRFDIAGNSSNVLNVPSRNTNITSSDSQMYSNSSASGTSDSISSTSSSVMQRKKLGLALLITVPESMQLDAVGVCLEHSPQLQAIVCRLRLATVAAGACGGFVATLYKAAADAAKCVLDLLYGPRLQPMWLTLVTSDARKSGKVADTLVADLCAVLAFGDTKDTNFFISTLMTHILTYHLGWVTTVSPYETVEVCRRPIEFSSASKNTYNAMWAQLTDLCGAIGYPPRSARTIISGSNNIQFLKRLLKVITYFLRCGDVKKNSFKFEQSDLKDCKTITVSKRETLKRIVTQCAELNDIETQCLSVPSVNTQNSGSFNKISSKTGMKRSSTIANLDDRLSSDIGQGLANSSLSSTNNNLRRNPTMLLNMQASSDSSLSSVTEESEPEEKVVFVLGDNEKLVGLKNKSVGGQRVKKSSKGNIEQSEIPTITSKSTKVTCEDKPDSKSKCCGQTLQHSKPIKHSGFKFEFDKYPQIVTNYMKSKNLEILDRHYIGKPGNLKFDNFQFDPTIVPPIQEESCETCYKCQLMESMLQTPTNASEMEYMNDIPRQSEPQYAKESIVEERDTQREISPKTFVRKRKPNTVVVNVNKGVDECKVSEKTVTENVQEKLDSKKNLDDDQIKPNVPFIDDCNGKLNLAVKTVVETECPLMDELGEEKIKPIYSNIEMSIPVIKTHEEPILTRLELRRAEKDREESKLFEVKHVIELPLPKTFVENDGPPEVQMSSFGGLTDHYVPDLVLQGTVASPKLWEIDLQRDLELTTYDNKTMDSPVQAVAIVADANNWEVRMVGRGSVTGGMSTLVGGILDVLPAMRRANVPAQQCLSFIEGKLREICVISKTLADMLMSTDFCDIATLTRTLNIDINDVPLLMAVATTHTPQIATRYGISYR